MTTARLDAATLAPPVVLDTGARRVEFVIAEAGVQQYPHGAEYVTPEALADPAHHDELRGIPLLYVEGGRHPTTGQPDPRWVTTADLGDAKRIGTLTGARFDSASGALIGEAVVDDDAGLAMFRRLGGVSEGYRHVDLGPAGVAPDGTRYDAAQVRRGQPNHIVITGNPRNPGANRARLDTGDPMEMEALKALLAGLLDERLDSMGAKMSERLDAMKADYAARFDSLKPPAPAERTDTADDWRPVLALAERHGVAIGGNAKLDDARKAVADAIMPGRADAMDPATVIAVAHATPARGSAWTAGGIVAGRTDSDADPVVAATSHRKE